MTIQCHGKNLHIVNIYYWYFIWLIIQLLDVDVLLQYNYKIILLYTDWSVSLQLLLTGFMLDRRVDFFRIMRKDHEQSPCIVIKPAVLV